MSLSSAEGTHIYYTINGENPTVNDSRYSNPFKFSRKGVVKAIAVDPTNQKQSEVMEIIYDIPHTGFKIVTPKADAKRTELFDGNVFSTYHLPAGEKSLTVDLGGRYTISGIKYLSDQNRWASGPIHSYTIKVDGREVASGEFSNIKNNPLERTVSFAPVEGSQVTVVANVTADGSSRASFAEFAVVTQ